MKLIQTLLIASAMAAMSTVDLEANNPYDGQYEVNHMDPRRSTWEHKEGEVIVKLKANNGAAPAKIRAAKGKVSSSSSALENMLRENGLQEAEQLMTLTGATVATHKAPAINGKPVADCDLSGLYALRFDPVKTRNIDALIENLQKLDEVEYAEPNYIVHICAEPESYTSDPL